MIRWSGADGTDLENSTALIKAIVNGTVSGNTIPTDIVFQTSATSGSAKAERVRIDSAGLVGIGTDSPQRLLHLMGGTAGTTILFTNPNTGNTTSDGSQINIRNDDNGFTLSQNENSYMNFRVNGSERARITSTGLFGIGTNAPVNLLQVEGSAPIIAIRDTASFSAYTNGGKIYFQGTDSTGAVKSFAGIRGVSQSSNNGQLRLQTRTGGTLYDRLTLNAAGQALFTAEGTADNGSIGIQSDEPFIRLEDTNGVANEKKWDMRVVGSSGNQQLMFRTVNDANNSFTTRLQLLHGGDVSIDDGNLVVANGHGIDFSASESGDATAGQSILDDYEQGTFTAYLYGHTTGSGSDRCTGTGYYTKVGNVVTCTLTFSNQNGNNLNDGEQVRVAGMPFTMHANGGNQTSSNIFSYNIGFETDEVHMFICASNASYLRGYRSRNVATWQPWSTTEFTVSGIYLTFNVTYLGLV